MCCRGVCCQTRPLRSQEALGQRKALCQATAYHSLRPGPSTLDHRSCFSNTWLPWMLCSIKGKKHLGRRHCRRVSATSCESTDGAAGGAGGGGPSSKMATYVQHAIAPISGPLWERPPILQTGCIHLGRRNSSTGPFKQLRRGWNCEAPCGRPSPRQLDIHVCTLGYLLSSQGPRSCPHASSGRSRRLSLLSSLWPSPVYYIPI